MTTTAAGAAVVDLASTSLRELNQRLHDLAGDDPQPRDWQILNPNGAHAVACGLDAPLDVEIAGHVGYYCAGMNKRAVVHVRGNAGTGPRCAISLKGLDIVVGGSIGHMSAFMAQRGSLVVCGDAGDALGDSIYETHVYVLGRVGSLGADCVEKPLREQHVAEVRALLERAGFDDLDPSVFRRYGSARTLYNFHVDHAGEY